MELSTLKLHLRITHSVEDELLEIYKGWAEDEVKDSVSTSSTRNNEFFENSKHYQRAVALLTAFYYENRVAYSDMSQVSMPDGVLSAIQKMRGEYHEQIEKS
ncbi:head-tail connector protein [Mammaliicoccus sciuri]|uniref:head-tail connector protein n=1 Tax=Mammaliicoccus sciuri TaxID=1296 RepID=UPI002B25AF38|nr:head-tail connector protein [Mammaliicoccus sciuri]MEB6233837.1 head-tail connector protein [Mammaliicoccus sciuri]WQL61675.1 head-tail connector protein [Mammaliicoccus sciuri]